MKHQINFYLQKAIQNFEDEDFEQAKFFLSSILETIPKHFEALCIMGVILGLQKNHFEALSYFKKAQKINPNDSFVNFNLALALSESGKDAEAIKYHGFATELAPDHLEAFLNFGKSLNKLERNNEAIVQFDRAIKINNDCAEAWSNKGIILAELKRYDEAIAHLDKAIQLNPSLSEAWSNKGIALNKLNDYKEALICFDKAIQLNPNLAAAWSNKGNALHNLELYDKALINHATAVQLDPSYAEAYYNQGSSLNELERYDEALISYQRAIELKPDYAEAYSNRGVALGELRRHDEALTSYQRAIELRPDYADAHLHRALELLRIGKFQEAWNEHEWRLLSDDSKPAERHFPGQVLIQKDLPKTGVMAIYAEQGLGDQILFSTLLPELKNSGQHFIYEVDERLLPVYRRSFPDCSFVGRISMKNTAHPALRDAGTAVYSGSLPRFFRPSVDSFSQQPRRVLQALPERAAHYRERLGPGFKVALSWHSARAGRIGRSKSVALAEFAPLLAISGVQGVDVQYGDTAAEREALAHDHGTSLVHFNEIDYRNDLDEVLAILEACDLLITTSNTTAHLGGALGKPVWLLYPAEHAPFHYWAHRGDHRCLWYPSVEIISDASLTDWKSLILHAAGKLPEMIGGNLPRILP